MRVGKWKLVSRYRSDWELYDMEVDRTESNNLAKQQPDQVQQMAALYDAWAKRCNVLPPDQLPPPRPILPAKVSEEPAPSAVPAVK